MERPSFCEDVRRADRWGVVQDGVDGSGGVERGGGLRGAGRLSLPLSPSDSVEPKSTSSVRSERLQQGGGMGLA